VLKDESLPTFRTFICIITPGQVEHAQESFPTQIIVIMHFVIYLHAELNSQWLINGDDYNNMWDSVI
jgi:hypothetical protein